MHLVGSESSSEGWFVRSDIVFLLLAGGGGVVKRLWILALLVLSILILWSPPAPASETCSR